MRWRRWVALPELIAPRGKRFLQVIQDLCSSSRVATTSCRVATSCSCQCWPFALIVARLNAKLPRSERRVFQFSCGFFFIFHSSFFKSNRFASLRFISLRFELIFVTCHVGVGLFLVFLLFQLPLRQQKSYVIFHFEMAEALWRNEQPKGGQQTLRLL